MGRRLVVIALVLAFAAEARAQTPVTRLTLEEAITLAARENATLREK